VAFEPDLVILGYDHNDSKPILGRIPPPMTEDYGRNFLHSELVRYVMRKLYLNPRFRIRNNVDGYIKSGGEWDQHAEALVRIADLCHELDVPLLAVVYDGMIRREEKSKSRHYRALHEPLNRLWQANGTHVVDCYDLFQEYMRRQGWEDTQPLWISIEPRDAHPDERGHELIAATIFATIQEQDLLGVGQIPTTGRYGTQ
jgi:hypothetical protein